MKIDGGPAFPSRKWGQSHEDGPKWDGMSLRDWFAGQAMAGDWAAQSEVLGGYDATHSDDWILLTRASLFYRMADAMLKVREE